MIREELEKLRKSKDAFKELEEALKSTEPIDPSTWVPNDGVY